MNNKEKREQVEYLLSVITGKKGRITKYKSDEEDARRLRVCEDCIDKINELTDGLNKEDLQEVLGGEFVHSYMNGEPFKVQSSEVDIPAYFLLDVASTVIKRQCSAEVCKSVLEKIGALREKTVGLEYDSLFDPKKEISEDLIECLLRRGSYDLFVKKEEGVRHLSVEMSNVYEDVTYRGGDYISNGATHVRKTGVLYEEDKKAIDSEKQKRIDKKVEELHVIAQRYFKDGKIPEIGNFKEMLLDEKTDSRIVELLQHISVAKTDRLGGIPDSIVVEKAAKEMEDISKVEIQIETEKKQAEEEKLDAIIRHRERVNEKNFLWRLINKKRLEKIDYSTMTTEEINNLNPDTSSKGGKGK